MSLFDYSAAKEALRKAGHVVSEGEHMLATDIKELIKFGRKVFGLPDHIVTRGMENVSVLPEGFPGTVAAPVAEAAPVPTPEAAPVEPAPAPVAEDAAPAQETAPEADATATEDATSKKRAKKADATDAPADGEQAAQ